MQTPVLMIFLFEPTRFQWEGVVFPSARWKPNDGGREAIVSLPVHGRLKSPLPHVGEGIPSRQSQMPDDGNENDNENEKKEVDHEKG